MIALDTSVLVAYLSGAPTGSPVDAAEVALAERQACLPPVVLTELLSDPKLPGRVRALFLELPLLEATPGYWDRAGRLRALVLGAGRRARLADTLVAQSCLDHDVPLVTLDRDFRHFSKLGGLRLI